MSVGRRRIFWSPGDGMKLTTAIEAFCRDSLQLSPASRAAYHSDLMMLTASIKAVGQPDSVFSFTPEAITRYLTTLSSHGRSQATLARKRAAVRTLTEWGREKDLWSADPLKGVPKIRKPKRLPRPYRKEELRALMLLPLPLVERLIRALLYYTGVRVSPLCRIRVEDVDLISRATVEGVPVAGTIRTVGKGDQALVIYVAPPLKTVLDEWFLAHPRLKPYDLLIARPNGAAYTRKVVESMTRRWGQAAGVKTCTPHRFRHSNATDLLEQLGDLRLVQEWLGHKDIKTTEGYTEVADMKRARAALVLRGEWK